MPLPDRYQEKRQERQFSFNQAARVSIQPVYGQLPGKPLGECFIESFNGKMRDELLKREILITFYEAKVLIEQWRKEYNQVRPNSYLRYRLPAPEAIVTTVTSLHKRYHYWGQGSDY